LGIGDWGLGIAQSPIPNPQCYYEIKDIFNLYKDKFKTTKL